jgi:hypothetical protein
MNNKRELCQFVQHHRHCPRHSRRRSTRIETPIVIISQQPMSSSADNDQSTAYLACINALRMTDEDDITLSTLNNVPSELTEVLHLIMQLQSQTIQQIQDHKTNLDHLANELQLLANRLEHLTAIRRSILYPEK